MEIATIAFADRNNGDDAITVVRAVGEAVGLALSLRNNGDTEVFMGKEELDQLIEALQKARATLPGVKPVV